MTSLLTNPITIHICVFAAVSALILAAIQLAQQWLDSRSYNRLKDLEHDDLHESRNSPYHIHYNPLEAILGRSPLPSVSAKLLPNTEATQSLFRARLRKAGISDLSGYFTARLFAMLVPPLAGLVLGLTSTIALESALLWGSVLGGCGIFLPGLWLDWKIARRQYRLRTSLSDFLDLFVSCLEGGMTLQAMIAMVSVHMHESHPELSGEFALCTRQIQLGQSIEAAVADMATRTGVEDLHTFQTFISQTEQIGANLSDALREMSDSLRIQREMKAEEMAQRASVKILFPTLLFIFPAIFVVLAGPAVISIQESMHQTLPAEPEAK